MDGFFGGRRSSSVIVDPLGMGMFNLSFEIIHFPICDTVHLKDLQVPFEDSEDLSPMGADVMPCYFGG